MNGSDWRSQLTAWSNLWSSPGESAKRQLAAEAFSIAWLLLTSRV